MSQKRKKPNIKAKEFAEPDFNSVKQEQLEMIYREAIVNMIALSEQLEIDEEDEQDENFAISMANGDGEMTPEQFKNMIEEAEQIIEEMEEVERRLIQFHLGQ